MTMQMIFSQQQKGEVALENSSPSKLNGDSTPAIPITSYSSFNNEDDDEDSDSESDEEKEKEDKIKFDLKKRKLDVIKINAEDNAKTTSNKKKKSEEVNAVSKAVLMEEEDEDEEGSSYFNVFKAEAGSKVAKQSPAVRTLTSKQLATLKTNVKKQPILKQPILKQQPVLTKQTVARQPIIKSGQTPKDREEVTLSFIGKYLKLKQIDRCLITVPFFLKKTRNGAQYRELNIIIHLHHLNLSYSIHFKVRFDRVKPKFFKKFEKVRVWYELELNWIYFYRVRLDKCLTFHSFTVFCFSSLFKFYLILIFHN